MIHISAFIENDMHVGIYINVKLPAINFKILQQREYIIMKVQISLSALGIVNCSNYVTILQLKVT